MFGLRFWGWVSWIFHEVTTEEVTFDSYVDRAVLIELCLYFRKIFVVWIFDRFPFDLSAIDVRRMDYRCSIDVR